MVQIVSIFSVKNFCRRKSSWEDLLIVKTGAKTTAQASLMIADTKRYFNNCMIVFFEMEMSSWPDWKEESF